MSTDHNHNPENNKDKPQTIKITKFPKIKIVDDGTASTAAKKANNISIISVIVNGILMICTVILAVYAIVQAKSSQSAATIAQNTLTETKRFNKETFRRQDSTNKAQAKSDSEKFKRDTTQFGLQKRTQEAQINAFKETEKEFQISNSPFLQISIEFVGAIEVGKPVDITIKIENLGSYPAKIINSITGATTRNSPPDLNMLGKYTQTTVPNNSYISNKNPITNNIPGIIPSISLAQYEMVNQGKWFLYVGGKIKYINLANGKIKEYKYCVKMNQQRSGFQYVKNDNYNLN